ncbi:type I-E CRISPR-associated endoribonuclease Cas2e [Edwardsiella anguillarum]|nr:type I-E CRISPR-associated endoribonuclease Cas2e [Edwardsiella anguillarum]
MKLWFIEPRLNTFISGIKDSVADTVIEYLYQHGSLAARVLIFKSIARTPGYQIRTIGFPTKTLCEINGLQLVVDKRLDQ